MAASRVFPVPDESNRDSDADEPLHCVFQIHMPQSRGRTRQPLVKRALGHLQKHRGQHHHRRRHREEGTSRKSAGLAAFLSAESRSEKHETQPLSGPANPPTRGPSQEGKKPRRGAETAKGDLTTGSTLSFLCRCFDALRVQSYETKKNRTEKRKLLQQEGSCKTVEN